MSKWKRADLAECRERIEVLEKRLVALEGKQPSKASADKSKKT